MTTTAMEVRMVDIDSITVKPDRFREANPSKVEDIAASMLRFSQLQPIIIDRDNSLVDGLHRLSAIRANGGREVAAIYRDEADEYFLREIELEANLQRQELTWQERERAIAKLHELKVQRDPAWTQQQTQQVVGAARQADVSEAVNLTKMMEMFPEIGKAKSKNQALSWAKQKAKNIVRTVEVRDNVIDFGAIESKIILGNSVDVIKTIPDESFNAIITDPPFGINYNRRKEGTSGSVSDYEDDEESYKKLLSMAPDLYRVLKKDGWLVWFFGMSWYQEVKDTFKAAGFVVDELPIIWDRSDGRAFTIRPDRYFGRVYDVAIHCIKGDPQMVQRSKPNIIKVPPVTNEERELMVERPVELYAELIRRLTVPGEIVADFFVGSGSCPAAAASLGRDYFGVELNPERRAYALSKIKAHTPDGK